MTMQAQPVEPTTIPLWSSWKREQITHRGQPVWVRFLAAGRDKLAVGEEDGKPYWYDRSRKRWCRVDQGGWAALRRQLRHIEDQHMAETPSLEKILRLCAECNLEFHDLQIQHIGSQGPEHNALWVKDAARRLDAALHELGNVIDDDKVEGVLQVWKVLVLNFRDSRGRVNKGVVLARTAAARQRFLKRLTNIKRMDAWIAYYGMVIERLLLEIDSHLQSAISLLESFKSRLLSEGLSGRKTKRTRAEFDEYCEHLKHLCHRPYHRAWKHLGERGREIRLLLSAEAPDLTRIMQLLETSLFSLRLLTFRSPLDRMKLHLRRWKDGTRPVENYRQKMERALERLIALTKKGPPSSFQLEEQDADLKKMVLDLHAHAEKAHQAVIEAEWSNAFEEVDRCLNII